MWDLNTVIEINKVELPSFYLNYVGFKLDSIGKIKDAGKVLSELCGI